MFFQSQQRSAETGMVSGSMYANFWTLLIGNLRNFSTYAVGAVIFSSDTPGFDLGMALLFGW